jgi:hypothetical protein
MSTPQQVAANLRKTARQLERIPDDALRDCADEVAQVANRLGGTFGAKRKRLGVNIKADKNSVIIRGHTAGAWAIKSYGRIESVAKGRALGTAKGDFHAKRSRRAGGDRRWDRVRQHAEDQSPLIIAEAVSKALG